MNQGTALRVGLSPSRRLAVWLAVVHGLTLVPLWLSGLPSGVPAALSVVVIAQAVRIIRRDAMLASGRSITEVALGPGQACTFTTHAGASFHARIADATLVTGTLVVIAVRRAGRRGSKFVAIVPGMADANMLRELRVRLRWNQPQAPEASQA
jgi:hypothetical protein